MGVLFGDKLKMLRGAAKSALDNAHNLSGKTNNPDLIAYSKLTPEALDVLAEQFGIDAVTDYIKHMEGEKVKRG